MGRSGSVIARAGLLGLLSWGLLLQGYSSPSGSATLFKVNGSNKLDSAFAPAARTNTSTTVPPATASAEMIKKNVPGVDMQGKDVYQIFLSDGYFKYLPDFNGVNEVVIVAEFTEVSSGTKGDTVTTVLGPFEGVADKSKTPAFNKLLYARKSWNPTRSA